MDFNKTKKVTNTEENPDDKYVQEMKSRLLIKKQKGVMGEDNQGKFYINDEQDTDRQIRFRLEFSANFWSVLLIGVFVSRAVYPSSIRFVKNRLGLEGFLNTHMAILPFIFMSNALVLGVYEGFWGHYWLMKEIEQKRNSITRL